MASGLYCGEDVLCLPSMRRNQANWKLQKGWALDKQQSLLKPLGTGDLLTTKPRARPYVHTKRCRVRLLSPRELVPS